MARQIVDGKPPEVPFEAANDRQQLLAGNCSQPHVRFRKLDRDLATLHGATMWARRLTTIPGIGPIGATALAASVTDPSQFCVRAAVRRLVGTDATSEVEWRQGTAWGASPRWATNTCAAPHCRHDRTRPSPKESPARSIRACRICSPESPRGSPRRDREQDRADRWASHGTRRHLRAGHAPMLAAANDTGVS